MTSQPEGYIVDHEKEKISWAEGVIGFHAMIRDLEPSVTILGVEIDPVAALRETRPGMYNLLRERYFRQLERDGITVERG